MSTTTTYVGVWINWSRGAILGATLTLPQEYGGLVAAFLAIYVTFAGGMFWNFLSFILHQINTTKPGSERDGLHHQLQVVLRNNGGAGSALWEFVKLPVYWRGKTQRPFHRVILFALLAAVNMAVFGVAGIFTSEVTKVPGNSTIILGPSCGGYKISSPTKINNSGLGIYRSKVLADTNEAAAYVRQCYGENTTSLACGVYNRRSLGFTTNPNATCPFASGLCVYNDNSAFSMDTGLIDSHSDLGANAPPEHRINYRRVTTCAPIHGKQFATMVNVTGIGPEVYVNAGPTSSTPYTFSYNLATRFDMGYALSAINAMLNSSFWEPVAMLDRTDADVTLMMLNQNDVVYEVPSDDPWMPAHNEGEGSLGPFWLSDYYVNLMGCIEQYQMCNPNKGNDSSACTKLSASGQVLVEMALNGENMGLNFYQSSIAGRIMENAASMNMYSVVAGRGATALNANEHTYENIQPPIPSTQWQTEVSIWFSTSLAMLQSYMVEWATAPTNNVLGPGSPFIVNTPTDPIKAEMCRNQLVHNTGLHQSFSILGMTLVLGLGGVMIVLGMVAGIVVGRLQTGRETEYRSTQWALEDKLQLQRAAYEGFGFGGVWERRLEDVPTIASAGVLLPSSSDAFFGECQEEDGGK